MIFSYLIAVIFCSLSLVHSTYGLTSGFPYGAQKVRGVNLGGWLVLEPWITPSIFDNTGDARIVDEYTFGQYQNHAQALPILKKHWDTWITEADFAAIAAAGLNHVRLPIGFWAFELRGGEPYIQGQLPYLQKAVTWAQKYNIKVIVDLHGVPGSQNGFDNSGQRIASRNQWYTQASNVNRAKDIITTLGLMYRDQSGVVPIIAPLNEPAGYFGNDVLQATKQYWYDSYGIIRRRLYSCLLLSGTQGSNPSNTVVLIHDAFQPPSYWKDFMGPPLWDGVMMDTHVYQMFSQAENQRSNAEHIQAACAKKDDLYTSTLPILVGEWTPGATDCAKYLNGRGVGSRYDGTYPGSTAVGSCDGLTGSASTFSASYKTFLRQYWEAQVITYEEAGQGWVQWTWKAENADEWTYQAGLTNGWIPQDPTALQYPDICS
ncbi:glycoside hydrolase family 5 protein [Flammula alnicola]|nr:glycoside hydrolase family 5 protein [Flammula alnicola]